MKNPILLAVFSLPLFATAGTIKIACIGPEVADCPVAVDVTLVRESLTAAVVNGMRDQTTYTSTSFGWCGPNSYIDKGYWSSKSCNETGTFRVINGEYTKRQLAEGIIQFGVYRPLALCMMFSEGPQCYDQ